jgi:hypothetical protein
MKNWIILNSFNFSIYLNYLIFYLKSSLFLSFYLSLYFLHLIIINSSMFLKINNNIKIKFFFFFLNFK